MFPPGGVIQQQSVPFATLVMNSSPYAYYDMQQSWSAGTLYDQSGNGRNITASNNGPSVGAAARSTTTQCAWWGSITDGAPATRAGNTYFFNDVSGLVLDGVMDWPSDTNQTQITLMWSMKAEPSMAQFVKIIGWRASNSASRMTCYTQYPTGTGHTVEFRTALNHTTNPQYEYYGNWTRDLNWHICTMRFHGGDSGTKAFFRNGVGGSSPTAYPGNNSIYRQTAGTSQFTFPGNMSSGGACYMKSDVCVLWNRPLSDAEIVAMHNSYMAELL
jgi:hypothetical protein